MYIRRLNQDIGKIHNGEDADVSLYVSCKRTYIEFSVMQCLVGSWCFMRGTLVALGKESKCVNLFDEVCHASPPSKSKSHHKNPHHHKCIDHIH